MNSENKENVAEVLATAKSNDKGENHEIQAETKREIEKLLAEGKRSIIGHDYQTALGPLSKCCHLIATNYGELDPMLAGIYLGLLI